MSNEAGADSIIKTIVVGVSDAETSHSAAHYAVSLARTLGASVHFVMAIDRAEIEVFNQGSDMFELDTLQSARATVENVVGSIAGTIDYSVKAVEGPPAKVLVSEAERVGADLIVVGNVRMQGVGRVLGSVGNDVVHHAPCSVLIVKTV